MMMYRVVSKPVATLGYPKNPGVFGGPALGHIRGRGPAVRPGGVGESDGLETTLYIKR